MPHHKEAYYRTFRGTPFPLGVQSEPDTFRGMQHRKMRAKSDMEAVRKAVQLSEFLHNTN